MTDRERLDFALSELSTKTLEQIQAETALVWAYRAAAAWRLGAPYDAVEYMHEAIEHAALTGDDLLLARVRQVCQRP